MTVLFCVVFRENHDWTGYIPMYKEREKMREYKIKGYNIINTPRVYPD